MILKNEQSVKPVALELFSAAWCNLDCTYCNIPKKNDFLMKEHQKIIEEIKDRPQDTVNRISKVYDLNSLEIISHWGTEPSLTLEYFPKFYDLILEKCPKFNTISFSSNFISHTTKVTDFINNFPSNKPINFDVQMSLDGPPYITDISRRQGSTKTIIKNIIKFIKNLNNNKDLVHKINVHFKPTLSKDYFKDLVKEEKIVEYYEFFNNVLDQMHDANSNNKVNISDESIHYTIVCPQDYTKLDGQLFNQMFLKTLEINKSNKYKFKYVKPSFSYYSALSRIIDFGEELGTKQKMFTCSAGDTQFGLNNDLNPCHDTYYIKFPEFNTAMLEDIDRLHDEIKFIENGSFKRTSDNLVCNIDNEHDILRYVHMLRGFHDYCTLKYSISTGIIQYMASCGLLSKVYKDITWASLLSIFANTRHACPTQNYVQQGSMLISHQGYYKLFGNGILENFVRHYYGEI